MRMATWNIDGSNRRLPNLLAGLDETRPDIVVLRQMKAADAQSRDLEAAVAGIGAASIDPASESPRPRPDAAGFDRERRGREGASGHAPVWVELTS